MFALGAVALTISMDVLVDTQAQGNEIATGIELRQVAALTASHVQEAGRVATAVPDAGFEATFDLPREIDELGYRISFYPPIGACQSNLEVRVISEDGRLTASVPIGNLGELSIGGDCLNVGGTLHSSAGSARVIYDPTAEPEITIQPAKVTP